MTSTATKITADTEGVFTVSWRDGSRTMSRGTTAAEVGAWGVVGRDCVLSFESGSVSGSIADMDATATEVTVFESLVGSSRETRYQPGSLRDALTFAIELLNAN